MMELHFVVPPQAEGRALRDWLRASPLSGALARSIKRAGGFFVDDVPVHTDVRLHAGQQIRFALPPEPPTSVVPQPVPLCIAWEDDFALLLDKPAGLAVHPTLNYPDGTLANGYLYLLAQRGQVGVFRPVNRIDKNTSGLVLCAKNSFAAPLLAAHVQKRYTAIVEGRLPLGRGRVEAPIARRPDSLIGREVREDGKPSCTEFEVTASRDDFSVVEVWPRTGRTHQIRVHMAYLGHPLAGDTLYGGHIGAMARQALHCAEICFAHPWDGRSVQVQSPLPTDMQRLATHCGLPKSGAK